MLGCCGRVIPSVIGRQMPGPFAFFTADGSSDCAARISLESAYPKGPSLVTGGYSLQSFNLKRFPPNAD